MQINISASFRRQAAKAILSIFFFVFVYFLLVALAAAITVACTYAGIMLIAFRPNFLTLVVGGGLMCVGFLILFFLIKFIFTKNKTDRSGFIEITRKEEPVLFAFIEDIVKQVNTKFPKKIYISGEVNASVFYDSGFWSMFLPVPKNLHIGLGLMNTITVDEFRAILAHEFGHFSQRSMKVGSYVYNVNYVLHNMLYDNNSFHNLAQKITGFSSYLSLFVVFGIKAVNGIKWILARVYNIVNLNYMALSREMEFHADEVAANIAGPGPVARSLMRAELANHSLQTVLKHYQQKINQNIMPKTLFAPQLHVMRVIAADYGLAFEDGLPLVTESINKRFNKSKLSFEDQWASHPGDEERIKRVNSLHLSAKPQDASPAFSLLKQAESLTERTTQIMFSGINYTGTPLIEQPATFYDAYNEDIVKNTLPKKFNRYFDENEIPVLQPHEILTDVKCTEEDLFSQKNVDLIYERIALENDIDGMNHLVTGLIKQKTFDYDGRRYQKNDTPYLLAETQKQLIAVKQQIEENNLKVFSFYYNLANNKGKGALLTDKYKAYISHRNDAESSNAITNQLYEMLRFVNESNTYDTINIKMELVYEKEKEFKQVVRNFMEHVSGNNYVNPESCNLFTEYLSNNHSYFVNNRYDDDALQLLFGSIYSFAAEYGYFLFMLKKDFLDLQASLTENNTVIA